MAIWSRVLYLSGQKLFKPNGLLVKVVPNNEIVRCMSDHHTLPIVPSRWSWHKTKDWLHFYFFLGAIPAALIIFCANVFVGPATLEPLPEGYIPKEWEYHRSPITRFFVKYICPSRQEEYEKYLHHVHYNWEIKRIRDLQYMVRNYIKEYQDYPNFAFRRNLHGTYVKAYRDYLDGKTS